MSTIRVNSSFYFSSLCLAALALFPFSGNARGNVFGTDDRRPLLEREHPWRCIGLVVAESESGVSTGTGFLIGRNLVLTNAHCTLDETGEAPSTRIMFFANRVDGVPSNAVHVNRVWRGTESLSQNPWADWAVMRLDSNLGDDLGWLELSTEQVEEAMLVGYSGDYREQLTPAVSPCSLHEGFAGVLFHDGDSTRGSSGGPIIVEKDGDTVVVGLHFAERRDSGDVSLSIPEYDDEHANMAFPASEFIEEVQAIIEQEEAEGLADLAKQARKEMGAGDYAAAHETLSKLIRACPDNSWAHMLRGYSSDVQGMAGAAAEDYQRALQIEPDCVELTTMRAIFSFATGNYQECVQVASRILMASKSNKLAYQLRAAAYNKLGQTRLATSDARRAASL
jgi:V8-like Glu-specific endopeptidase